MTDVGGSFISLHTTSYEFAKSSIFVLNFSGGVWMTILDDVKQMLSDVLQLGDDFEAFSASTPLLGNIPELDSMGVVSLLTSLEEFYGFVCVPLIY